MNVSSTLPSMIRPMPSVLHSMLVTFAVGLLGIALTAPFAAAEETVKTFAVTGRAQVRVETNDASVHVTTSDTKQVEFHVTYQGYELDKDLHVDAQQQGNQVSLNAHISGHWGMSWGHNSRNVRIEVRMPRSADLTVDTSDGSVTTDALDGTLKIHTSDGSVKSAAVAGNVDIDTSDGSVTLDGAKGSIHLRTSDGHIEAHNLDGSLDATSGDGHLSVEGRFDALSLKTGDGSINARALPGSKMTSGWTIHTGDGSVDFSLPADLQANIEATTHDGRISMGLPIMVDGTFSKSEIHGKLNGGGQPLTISTGDGSIRLSKT